MRRVASTFVALVLLGSAALWAGRQPAPVSLDAHWAERYGGQLRRVLNLPPLVELQFKRARSGDAGHPAVAEFDAVVENDRYPLELTVSRDGNRLFYEDRVYRLADPFGNLRAQISLADAPARGPANAPLTIVEYADYTCVFCRRFALTLEQPLLERYAGRVRLVYKHFPLTEMRPHAEKVSLAAACAFQQGNEQFWAYHEKLFEQADHLRKGDATLLRLAQETGLDLPAFRRCLESRRGGDAVARDVSEGEALGIGGTPAFFFNGRPVYGLVRPEYFFYIADQELAAAGRP
jgi:predicted DsbA family dithiol-disulfide isomerase